MALVNQYDLWRLRKAAGLTQEQLAEKLCVTPHYISMIERGRRPLTPWLALKSAEIFGVEDSQHAENENQTCLTPAYITGGEYKEIVNTIDEMVDTLIKFKARIERGRRYGVS